MNERDDINPGEEWTKASPEDREAAYKALYNISSEESITPEPEENDIYLPLTELANKPQEYLDEYIELFNKVSNPAELNKDEIKLLTRKMNKIRAAFVVASHDNYYKNLLASYIERIFEIK